MQESTQESGKELSKGVCKEMLHGSGLESTQKSSTELGKGVCKKCSKELGKKVY